MLGKQHDKMIKRLEMWVWKKNVRMRRVDRLISEEVIRRIEEKRAMLSSKRKMNCLRR